MFLSLCIGIINAEMKRFHGQSERKNKVNCINTICIPFFKEILVTSFNTCLLKVINTGLLPYMSTII